MCSIEDPHEQWKRVKNYEELRDHIIYKVKSLSTRLEEKSEDFTFLKTYEKSNNIIQILEKWYSEFDECELNLLSNKNFAETHDYSDFLEKSKEFLNRYHDCLIKISKYSSKSRIIDI